MYEEEAITECHNVIVCCVGIHSIINFRHVHFSSPLSAPYSHINLKQVSTQCVMGNHCDIHGVERVAELCVKCSTYTS